MTDARDLAATVREALEYFTGALSDAEEDKVDSAWKALAALEQQAADAHEARLREAEAKAAAQWAKHYDDAYERAVRAEEALRRIKANAESWHGAESEGTGAAKALAVIATWCDAALAAAGADTA